MNTAPTSPPERPEWWPYFSGAALVCLLVLAMSGMVVWQEARHHERTVQTTSNQLELLAQHITDIFNQADVLLEAVALDCIHRLHHPNQAFDNAEFKRHLERLLQTTPTFLHIRVLDENTASGDTALAMWSRPSTSRAGTILRGTRPKPWDRTPAVVYRACVYPHHPTMGTGGGTPH